MTLALVLSAVLPTIWIVDASNGPGTNFVDLPAAIAAAQSGDTLLVRPGNYNAFQVAGKALTIRGSGRATTRIVTPAVTIGATPGTDAVTLSGIALAPTTPNAPALVVQIGAVVVLLDATVTGAPESGSGTGADGALVNGTLHAARCLFFGGGGTATTTSIFAGDGVHVVGGKFAADACTCTGGDALGTIFFGVLRAGHGVRVDGGRATLTHTSGLGGSCGAVQRIPGAGNGGGLVAVNGAFARIAGTAVDRCVAGSFAFGGIPPAAPNTGIVTDFGSTVLVHGTFSTGGTTGTVNFAVGLPRLVVNGTQRPSGETDGQLPVTITLDGQANAPFALLVDTAPEYGFTPYTIVIGELLVPITAPVLFSALDGAGHLQLGFVPATTIPQVLGRPLYLQAGVLDGVSVLASSRETRIFAP